MQIRAEVEVEAGIPCGRAEHFAMADRDGRGWLRRRPQPPWRVTRPEHRPSRAATGGWLAWGLPLFTCALYRLLDSIAYVLPFRSGVRREISRLQWISINYFSPTPIARQTVIAIPARLS